MRQLRDADPKPRYADYERVAQQLEVDRPHWNAETQEEWRVFRRAANEEADDWKRARMSDRIVASPTPGERPESPQRTPPRGGGGSPAVLPRIKSTSSYELERSKTLTAETAERMMHGDAKDSPAARRKQRTSDGMLHTRMHAALHGSSHLQKKLMAHLAQSQTRYAWQPQRQSWRPLPPQAMVLRVVGARDLQPGSAPVVRVSPPPALVAPWRNPSAETFSVRPPSP